ncbi:MAG: N-acetyltransferase family protein [Fimbriimonadaceae bacterium]
MIRPATPQDAPHIATIKIDSWRKAYAQIIRPETLANLNHKQETQKFLQRIIDKEHILVATNPQNQPIAYSLWIQLPHSNFIQTDWPLQNMLASLYVHPNHTGQGIGTALIRANAQLAINNKHQGMMIGVFTKNTQAKTLYTRLGAQFIKETTFTVDGTAYPDELLAFHNLNDLTNP